MTWDEWIAALPAALAKIFAMTLDEARSYVEATGADGVWREMFDTGLSPAEAAEEEWCAARDLHAWG